MPSDTATATATATATTASAKRLSASRAEQSNIAGSSDAPADTHTPTHKPPGGHKHQRHVVGHAHGRLGARNPSVGRNLAKLTTQVPRDDDSLLSARGNTPTTPLSPKPRPAIRRNHTSNALMPKNTAHTALRKNHSSGHLVRNTSHKQLSKSVRPEAQRSNSHSHQPRDRGERGKRKPSPEPGPQGRHPSVHFDMGDDDEGDEMEGVDDGWTEESASQSPSTTRDNTRSNTRNNSVILDPDENPHKKKDDEPPDQGHMDAGPRAKAAGIEVVSKDFAQHPTSHERNSSYQEGGMQVPIDTDAIAKKLLQRTAPQSAAPKVSGISAVADRSLDSQETRVGTGASLGSAPLVSRFIDAGSAPDSKSSTPHDHFHVSEKQAARLQKSPSHSARESPDMKRNQSTPSFMSATTLAPHDGGSGASTPGGPLRPSRTQQKLWLQRGLSNIEANSQQNLPGLLTPGGRPRSGGAVPSQYERIEKELAVVRRFRHPIEESMDRLRQVRDSPLKRVERTSQSPSPRKSNKSRDGTRTPGGQSIKTSSPTSMVGRQQVSFALSAHDDVDDSATSASRPFKDWDDMTLDELDEATLEVRRQMWDLNAAGDVDD